MTFPQASVYSLLCVHQACSAPCQSLWALVCERALLCLLSFTQVSDWRPHWITHLIFQDIFNCNKYLGHKPSFATPTLHGLFGKPERVGHVKRALVMNQLPGKFHLRENQYVFFSNQARFIFWFSKRSSSSDVCRKPALLILPPLWSLSQHQTQPSTNF